MATPARRLLEAIVFLLLGIFLFAPVLPQAWRKLNTDFPNYYLTTRLAHEGVDASRAYEWIWIEREKDHRSIDQRIVGLVPITPFSTLLLRPVVTLPPLQAKHVWIVFNLLLLIVSGVLLGRIAGLSLLEAGILIVLSVPLQFNLLYGQFYVVVLVLLAAACLAAQHGRRGLAGALVGLAIAFKVFPLLLTLHFLRKRDWRALIACAGSVVASTAISIAVFGWSMHRTYLLQVLPWTLRGEDLDPYNLRSGSFAVLLHRLFVYEPLSNPHPALHAAWLFAVLHPMLQLALVGPVFLAIDPDDRSADRTALEWAALLLAALAISPLPASYHFTVILLPIAILCGHLLRRQRYLALAAVLLLYLAVGYPGWNMNSVDGWQALLRVPRLYALILLTLASIALIKRPGGMLQTRGQRWCLAGIAALLVFNIASGLHHQRRLFDDYAYRLAEPEDDLIAAQPVASHGTIHYIALMFDGYRARTLDGAARYKDELPGSSPDDQLSVAASDGTVWTETTTPASELRSSAAPALLDAESPAISFDGRTLAYLRPVRGRKQLFLHAPGELDRQLTPFYASMNVAEVAFVPDGSLIVSAAENGAAMQLYRVSLSGRIDPMNAGEARYPAVSRDGHWLAFSRFAGGSWNLYLRDLQTGATRRLTDAPCNQIQPSWEDDSKTLLYATDCGRALWFTAIARRRFVP